MVGWYSIFDNRYYRSIASCIVDSTDRTATVTNHNILWAFPLNLIFCTLVSKKVPKKWIKSYVSFLIILLTLLVVHWFTGVQVFAPALLPLVIALFIRYVYLVRYLKR